MSLLIDGRECPQCHGAALYMGNCWEDWLLCPFCGYHVWVVPVIDRKGGAEEIKRTKDGKPIRRSYERKGYGAYCLASKSGRGKFGGISKKNLNDAGKIIAKFKRSCKERDVDPTASYLTKWDEAKKNVLLLAGSRHAMEKNWAWLKKPERLFEIPN